MAQQHLPEEAPIGPLTPIQQCRIVAELSDEAAGEVDYYCLQVARRTVDGRGSRRFRRSGKWKP